MTTSSFFSMPHEPQPCLVPARRGGGGSDVCSVPPTSTLHDNAAELTQPALLFRTVSSVVITNMDV